VTDEQKPDKGKEEAKLPASPIAQPPIAPPEQPPAPPNANQPRDSPQPPRPPDPILVQLVGGDDLEPFEEQTLALTRENLEISRRTYRIAVFAFVAAALAAGFVFMQVKEMSHQTQILASQSESAAAGAAIGELNTRIQLDLMKQQARRAGESVDQFTKQVAAMTQQLDMERQALRLYLGGAVLTIIDVHFYHWNDNKDILVELRIKNRDDRVDNVRGFKPTEASNISLNVVMGFNRKEVSKAGSCSNQGPLPPGKEMYCLKLIQEHFPDGFLRRQALEGGGIYLRGTLVYNDIFGARISEPFCKRFSAEDALSGGAGKVPPMGHSFMDANLKDCPDDKTPN
jgi:hypothetical protein